MEAKVTLSTMHFYAYHGCYATERKVGGRFSVDMSYRYDATIISQSDDVSSGVSYLDVYEFIRSEMGIVSNTLEHVARRILDGFLLRFSAASWCELRIQKLSPPLGGDVCSAGVVMSAVR